MNKKDLINEKINILKYSIKIINYWTLFLIFFAIILFLISFHIIPFKSFSNDTINETLKFGFSILSVLIPIGLQGFNFIKKNDLVNLKFISDNIESYEKLTDLDKKIFEYIMTKLFK